MEPRQKSQKKCIKYEAATLQFKNTEITTMIVNQKQYTESNKATNALNTTIIIKLTMIN